MNEKKINELLAKGKKLYEDGLAIESAAKAAGRDMTAEELKKVSGLWEESLEAKREADKLHELDTKRAALDSQFNQVIRPTPVSGQDDPASKALTGDTQFKLVEKVIREKGLVAGQAFTLDEQKTLSRLTGENGGFWLGEQFSTEVVTLLRNLLHLRQLCRVIPTNASKFVLPTGRVRTSFNWRPDNSNVTPGSPTSPAGQIEFSPHTCMTVLQIPNELLQDAAFNLRSFILDELTWGMSEEEEKKFLNGTGSGEPKGLLMAGGLTGQDAETSGASTIVSNDIQGLPMKLLAQYRANGSWLIPRVFLSQIMLLKDSTNRYLWQPDFSKPGAPITLVGYPVRESEYFPTMSTTGDPFLIFGDFRRGYTIVDRIELEVKVLNELYATANQTGVLLVKRTDGQIVDKNALIRLNRKA